MQIMILAACLVPASLWTGVNCRSLTATNEIAPTASLPSLVLKNDYAPASHIDPISLVSHEGFHDIEKRSTEAIDICFQKTLTDPANYDENGWRDPATWWEAPEWYSWVNATCIRPGYSPVAEVFCKKVRHLGLHYAGRPFLQVANCPENKPVCENTMDELDPSRPTGHLVPDITCVTTAAARIARVTRDRKPKHWCSDPEPLGTYSSRTRSSYKLTMEVQSTSHTDYGHGTMEESEMWFEVISSWWKTSHRLADRIGHVTTAIINTAPALGKTYVKFCALLKADTKSYVLPRVAIIYSAAVVGKHREIRPPGGPHPDTAIVLDVSTEPEGSTDTFH